MWIGFKKRLTRGDAYLICLTTHDVHKLDTIYNLVDWSILLSQLKFYQKNLEMIVEVLQNNGYPLKMIFKGYLTQGSKNFYHQGLHTEICKVMIILKWKY